jgi:predicted DNA-binding transcriptional regulator YafY
MLGFCRSKEEIRTFRLSRVKRLLVLPEVFEREFPVEAASTEECREECPDPVLKLKFSPEIAYRLYDEFQENQVCLCEDGNYYVTAPYELNHWTMHYLLSFGKYVEVIGPEEARVMLKEIVSEILKKYT